MSDDGPASGSSQSGQAANQAGQPQLVQFQGSNGFVVLMPPNPQTENRTQDTPGGPVQVHIAQAQDASGKYMSSLSEFPKGSLDKVKSKDLLDSLQQATIQSMGGTLVNSHDVQAGDLPGREFTATDPGGSEVTARVFVGASRVYTLAGTYPKGQVPPSIQQFLGSFQPPPAASAVGGSGTGGSGAADDSAASSGADATSGTMSSDADSSAAAAPAQPPKKQKKSRRSSSTTSDSSSDTVSGSR